MGSRRRVRLGALCLLGLALPLLLDLLIETDEEAIESLLNRSVRCITEGPLDDLEATVLESFEARDLRLRSRDELVERLQRETGKFEHLRVDLDEVAIEEDAPGARARIRGLFLARARGLSAVARFELELALVRGEEGGWWIGSCLRFRISPGL